MKNKRHNRDWLFNALWFGCIGFLVVAVLGLIAFTVWVHVHFANYTIQDIPAWALWFMFNK